MLNVVILSVVAPRFWAINWSSRNKISLSVLLQFIKLERLSIFKYFQPILTFTPSLVRKCEAITCQGQTL
jgi:hypothetical protein